MVDAPGQIARVGPIKLKVKLRLDPKLSTLPPSHL